jgi:hypothetical protein
MQTIAYNPKTPVKPRELIIRGRVYVTMISLIQNVRLHIAEQMARTLAGKISEQKMLGIGPNPITNMQKYTMTLVVERAACNPTLKSTMLTTIKTSSASTKIGMVTRSSFLDMIRKSTYHI